jgi:ADP-ribose pyrophosphatase
MSTRENRDFTEHMLESRTVYQGRLLHVVEDSVRLPDGRSTTREYIRHPGAVMMVPLTDRGEVVLVRQYRYPLRRHFIEIPAGKIEPGEPPLATGQRELREECGIEAASWRYLATVQPCIGYSDERIELYLARGLTRVATGPAEGEFIETLEIGLPEALAWVQAGKITEVKSIIGLMWAEKLLRAEWPV